MKHIHIEGTGKPLKVVSPVDNDFFHKGKEHRVIGYWGMEGFCIINPATGNEIHCLYDTPCSHIEGGNWIVTERETTSNTD